MNTVIQEVLHTFINGLNPDVAEMIDKEEDEHDLGKIVGYLNRRVTPMSTGYAFSSGERGSCSSRTGTFDNWTTSTTGCTKDAIKYTAEDVF